MKLRREMPNKWGFPSKRSKINEQPSPTVAPMTVIESDAMLK